MTLRLDGRSLAVLQLQKRLNELGASPRLYPDGHFGPATERASIRSSFVVMMVTSSAESASSDASSARASTAPGSPAATKRNTAR